MSFNKPIKIPLWNGSETEDILAGQKFFEGIPQEISLHGSPVSFSKYAFNPVLNLGPNGTWDDTYVMYQNVIKDGSTYKMWYTGYDGSTPHYRMGYATSLDGITWTKYASNPIIPLGSGGSWDDGSIYNPCVIKDGSTYKMWFTADDEVTSRIGYATSLDGITWTKYASNPVLSAGTSGTWDDGHVAYPSVIKDGSTYKMWYVGYDGGSNYSIGYATSLDGITWTKYASNPVLSAGTSGTWNDGYVFFPFVIKDGSTYKMWYTGYDGGSNYSIGYATSLDGITWTTYASNPVLSAGTSGTWDDGYVTTPCVIKDDATYKMWYSGYDGATSLRIGYATSNAFPATAPSPTTTDWFFLPLGSVVDMSTIVIPELMNNGDLGTVEYQYAVNGGALNGTWLSQAGLKAESDPTITNATNSIKIVPRYNGNGTQKTTSQAFAVVDIIFSSGGGAAREQIGGLTEVQIG